MSKIIKNILKTGIFIIILIGALMYIQSYFVTKEHKKIEDNGIHTIAVLNKTSSNRTGRYGFFQFNVGERIFNVKKGISPIPLAGESYELVYLKTNPKKCFIDFTKPVVNLQLGESKCTNGKILKITENYETDSWLDGSSTSISLSQSKVEYVYFEYMVDSKLLKKCQLVKKNENIFKKEEIVEVCYPNEHPNLSILLIQ